MKSISPGPVSARPVKCEANPSGVANLMKILPKNVFDLQKLREKTQVFSDRFHAGEILSGMLEPYQAAGGLLPGIPAGGLPVASVIREKMALEMDVAVPTGHLDAVQKIAEQVDEVFCPKVRSGMSFAVADACVNWSDAAEEELLEILS